MKQTQKIGPYTWQGIPGQLMVEVTNMTPNEHVNYRNPAGHPVAGPTIKELKQQFGGMQGTLFDGIASQPFTFDLSPWSHLDENTHLVMAWIHKATPPVPISDPRHPLYGKNIP